MPSLKDLRNRIASVKATRKITKAMQMVAAMRTRMSLRLAIARSVLGLFFFPSPFRGGTRKTYAKVSLREGLVTQTSCYAKVLA